MLVMLFIAFSKLSRAVHNNITNNSESEGFLRARTINRHGRAEQPAHTSIPIQPWFSASVLRDDSADTIMAELIGQLGDTQSQRRGRERRDVLDVLSQRSRLYELSANSVVTYCELGG